jgi:hypothetical protein
MDGFYQNNFVLIWFVLFTVLSIWLMTLFSRNAQKIKRLMEEEQREILQRDPRENFKPENPPSQNNPENNEDLP